MNKILEEIVAKKKEELRGKKKRVSLEELRGQVKEGRGTELFYKVITRSINDPAVIAEVKFASPSMGDVDLSNRPHPDPLPPRGLASSKRRLQGEGNKSRIFEMSRDLLERVKEYELAGADAISIITEKHFFKGDLSFVSKVKEAVSLPVLQKDFVIDEYQIYESKQAGADALLLIARLVDGDMLSRFVSLTKQLGIEPVVEINDEKDLEKAVISGTNIIAVNARDLDTFEMDVERACELMNKIPEKFVRLGFSAIQSRDEVGKYREAGARGVLVGTALMKTSNIAEFIEEIRK